MTASAEPGSGAAFGSLLRRFRLAAGLTHEALADAAGLSVRGLSDLERGLSRRPQKETLRRLASALSLAPEDRNRFEAVARGRGVSNEAAATGESALPTSATPLIGRAVDVSVVKELFNDPTVRLVTLTGPGGVGKTRLALQVIEELKTRYPAGVTVVNLAPLRSPDAVAEATARALGLREALGTSWQDQLHALLRDEPRLLLLDNFEHVLPAAMVVSELLAHCPRLRVIVTSRARLRLSAEHEVVVAPLAVPSLLFLPSTEELAATPSIALFVQRARAVDGGFSLTGANAAAVAELGVRLDGLPLAIELAAVRTKLLTPAAILARLHQRLYLLTGGAQDLPARQQTLRQTLDWSYELLDERTRRWFRRLAVFVGGWSLDAAGAVCGDGAIAGEVEVFDVMAALQDASLIQRVVGSDAEPRFTMLETVLAYAKDRLEAAGEAGDASRRHAEYFVGIAEQAVPTWSNAQRTAWYGPLAAQVENVRAALQWSSMGADPVLGLRLAAGLHWFWETYAHGIEGRYWCEEALKRNPSLRHTAVGVRALCAAGALAWQQGDHAAARAELEECITAAGSVA